MCVSVVVRVCGYVCISVGMRAWPRICVVSERVGVCVHVREITAVLG